MSQTEAIVNAICVDKVEDNYDVGVNILTPADGRKADYRQYFATGKTLGQAMENISISIGKEMGFSQCEIMAFGDNLCEDGIMTVLDFMVRLKKVSKNAMLINFGGEVKDFIKASYKLHSDKQLSIDQIINFDRQYILSHDGSIDNFYRGYFDTVSVGVLPKVTVLKQETDNAIQVKSGGESQTDQPSASSAQSSEEDELYLLNNGTMCVFKKGKKQMELDYATVQELNLFVNKYYKGLLVVNNVSDELYDNATVVMNITKTQPKLKAVFKNGKPVYKIDLTLTMYIEEVVQNEQTLTFMQRNKEFYTPTLLKEVKQEVEDQMKDAISLCKTNNTDLLKVYQNFYAFKNKEFKNYLDSVGFENYLEGIDYDINIKIESAY